MQAILRRYTTNEKSLTVDRASLSQLLDTTMSLYFLMFGYNKLDFSKGGIDGKGGESRAAIIAMHVMLWIFCLIFMAGDCTEVQHPVPTYRLLYDTTPYLLLLAKNSRQGPSVSPEAALHIILSTFHRVRALCTKQDEISISMNNSRSDSSNMLRSGGDARCTTCAR